MQTEIAEYGWADSEATCAHDYLLPAILASVKELFGMNKVRILDLGCGNGYVTSRLAGEGHDVLGLDAATDGIAVARAAHPELKLQEGSIYASEWPGVEDKSFDCVVSLEVVEHLLFPKALFKRSYQTL